MTAVDATPIGVSVSAAELIALKRYAPQLSNLQAGKTAAMSGQYLSKQRGRGLEFAEVRHYQPGDDVRAIDWRVTARSGKTHTRLYVEERERPILIACDLRLNMCFGTRKRFKSIQAANISALLAWAAQARGDRVGGIIAANNSHTEVRPGVSNKNVSLFMGLLAKFSDPSSLPQQTQPLSLTAVLAEARRVAKPGSHVYIIGDFHDWQDSCAKQLALICRHNSADLILVSDNFEQQLPHRGNYSLKSGERQITLNGGIDGAALTAKFQQRLDVVQRCCRQYRAGFLHITTDADAVAALANLAGRNRHA